MLSSKAAAVFTELTFSALDDRFISSNQYVWVWDYWSDQLPALCDELSLRVSVGKWTSTVRHYVHEHHISDMQITENPPGPPGLLSRSSCGLKVASSTPGRLLELLIRAEGGRQKNEKTAFALSKQAWSHYTKKSSTCYFSDSDEHLKAARH